MIRVREREVLNFPEQIRTEIFGKALTGHGGAACAQNTAGHGAAGNDDHDDADCQNEAVAVCDKCLRKQLAQHEILLPVEAAVHDDGHQHRDQDLEHDLQPAEDCGGKGPDAVAPQIRPYVAE